MVSQERLPIVEDIYGNHDDIVEEYDLVHDSTGAHFPDRKLQAVIDDARETGSDYEAAASLLQGLIRRHVFEDGNKRTAWVTSRAFLQRCDREVQVNRDEVPAVLRAISRYDTEELSRWLRTGEIDRTNLRD